MASSRGDAFEKFGKKKNYKGEKDQSGKGAKRKHREGSEPQSYR